MSTLGVMSLLSFAINVHILVFVHSLFNASLIAILLTTVAVSISLYKIDLFSENYKDV